MYHTLTVLPPKKPKPRRPTAHGEEEDHTGDSGMDTGSGSSGCGNVHTWRQAIKNPPPGI